MPAEIRWNGAWTRIKEIYWSGGWRQPKEIYHAGAWRTFALPKPRFPYITDTSWCDTTKQLPHYTYTGTWANADPTASTRVETYQGGSWQLVVTVPPGTSHVTDAYGQLGQTQMRVRHEKEGLDPSEWAYSNIIYLSNPCESTRASDNPGEV